MKLLINGSLLANALLVSAGAVLGAGSYWTVENFDLVPGFLSADSQLLPKKVQSPKNEEGDVRVWVNGSYLRDRSGGTASSRKASLAARISEATEALDPKVRAEMLSRAGAEGARRDVEEALKIGHSLKRLRDRIDYFRGLFGTWSEIDAEAALNYAKQNLNAGLLQSELISLVVNKWGAADPQDARMWTQQNLSGPIREQALTDLMVGWTRRNPDLAANWLVHSGNRSASMLSAVGSTWAEQDPRAAALWAGGLAIGGSRKVASLAVANEWTRQDPKAAATFFEEKLDGSEGIDLATIIADVWGTSDPAAASLWVSDLPTGSIRNQAAGTLATVWATRDIEAAARWSDRIDDPSMRSQVVAHLATTWGALEPDRAVEWLAGLSPELAQVGMVGALNSWSAVDPSGMRDWVENGEQSFLTDQARRSLADVVSQDDILGSIDLAMGIVSDQARNNAVARYFRQWRKTDNASAQEWIGEAWSIMPEDLRARLKREQTAVIVPRN